jgi:hypothetical protein
VLNGPEDVAGEQIVNIAEKYIGEPVSGGAITYADLTLIDGFIGHYAGSENINRSIKDSVINTWNYKAKTDTASEENRAIYALKHTVRHALGAAWLGGILLIIVTSLRLNSKFQFF